MNTRLFCLTLASLLLAPALGGEYKDSDGHWLFRHRHTVTSWRPFTCDYEMMLDKQLSASTCSASDVIILGDTTDSAPEDDINDICRGKGTAAGNDVFTSVRSFRLVKCVLEDNDAVRPDCHYKAKYMQSQISVRCKDGFPVALEGSE